MTRKRQTITFQPPKLGPDGHYARVSSTWCDKHLPTPVQWWKRPFKRWLSSYVALQGTPNCPKHAPEGK